jgi:hypothetical protein
MIAAIIVRGLVPRRAQYVEQFAHFFREAARKLESSQQIRMALVLTNVDTQAGGGKLGDKLGKLSQFDVARIGIVGKVALSERAQPEQLRLALP